jgi:two-component system OmpR family sensor kinase
LRDEIARDSALRTLAPFLLLVPILLLLVRSLIGKMFAPLKTMASDLDHRREEDLQPITDGSVPAEIRPFVVAIDRLLARVGQSMAMQRRFVADAAHELRSPMTALSLQAQQLETVDISAPGRQRLAALRGGIQRTRELLDQLLALARVQEQPRGHAAKLSLRQTVREVLEDLMPLAESKRIDIGVEGVDDAVVRAHEVDLRTLIRNLIDNAIRYTPDGGRIDLHIDGLDGGARLQIDDSGPGIIEQERARVFDPFYRLVGSGQTGSGLGLSIAKAVADRIHATIELGWADEQRRQGLSVRVNFPKTALGDATRSRT